MNFDLAHEIKAGIDELARKNRVWGGAEFSELCDKVFESLNSLGHELFKVDEGGADNELWATRYRNSNPFGLEIDVRPNEVVVLWVIGAYYRP